MDEKPQPDRRVRLWVEDHTGNRRREARIAADVEIGEIIPALITALQLPATDPSGRPISYHLAFGERQLQRDETLASAAVQNGATVTLVPELTAG